jgi:putative glutamine amidotransferase
LKPRILISRSPESSGLYEAAVEKAGGEPVSLHCPDPEMDFDALILAGGGDMDPIEFREENHGSVDIDVPRDKAELALIGRCVQENKPILGICRGHQVVNIALGGNIYQDMNDRLVARHGQTPEGENRYHPIRVGGYTMLDTLYGKELTVNSSHHQAIYKFGQGLYGTAWDEDGVVEAMQHGSLPIWTVQFHPEQMTQENCGADGQKIFDFFLDQCRKNLGL